MVGGKNAKKRDKATERETKERVKMEKKEYGQQGKKGDQTKEIAYSGRGGKRSRHTRPRERTAQHGCWREMCGLAGSPERESDCQICVSARIDRPDGPLRRTSRPPPHHQAPLETVTFRRQLYNCRGQFSYGNFRLL